MANTIYILSATGNCYDAVEQMMAWWSAKPTVEKIKIAIKKRTSDRMPSDEDILDMLENGSSARYCVNDNYGYYTYRLDLEEEAE